MRSPACINQHRHSLGGEIQPMENFPNSENQSMSTCGLLLLASRVGLAHVEAELSGCHTRATTRHPKRDKVSFNPEATSKYHLGFHTWADCF